MVSSRRKEHNNYYCKLQTHIIIILIRENFRLLKVLKSSHSKTCLPENAYVASALMVVGIRCALRVQWRFLCNEVYDITFTLKNTRMQNGRER
ncbi:hypothetical protein T07_14571 [Trichinella nelsoni]|uniref:Uncharacterized protein n=1 Tax=Trichinella nelsoni TaxID=6336 RepID=A0A0V0RJH7_9BILA|nr:hypothetical protein T07_14571 [Trichinella nelsoni]